METPNTIVTPYNPHPTWFPHDRHKAVLALLLTFGCATIKSYPSNTSAKNTFHPPHSWPSIETATCVPSLPSTTRQPSCYTSWLGLGWRKNCQCLYSWKSLKGVQVMESPAGVVVEVLSIRILHLANLQCGWWRILLTGRNKLRKVVGFSNGHTLVSEQLPAKVHSGFYLTGVTIHNLHPTSFPHDRHKAVLALLLTFGCATITSHPSSTSAKNTFCPPHSWTSLETAKCVPSLPSTTRQPSCYTSWLKGKLSMLYSEKSLRGVQVKGESGWGSSWGSQHVHTGPLS